MPNAGAIEVQPRCAAVRMPSPLEGTQTRDGEIVIGKHTLDIEIGF